jgi:hypothetical protein
MNDNQIHELKFYKRNKNNVDKLNLFLEKNKDELKLIITSPELYEWLKMLENPKFETDAMFKYKNIRVLKNPYHRTNLINFVMKNNEIEFDMPCVCGIYKDEGHP